MVDETIIPALDGLSISHQDFFNSLQKLEVSIGGKISALLKPPEEQLVDLKDS